MPQNGSLIDLRTQKKLSCFWSKGSTVPQIAKPIEGENDDQPADAGYAPFSEKSIRMVVYVIHESGEDHQLINMEINRKPESYIHQCGTGDQRYIGSIWTGMNLL